MRSTFRRLTSAAVAVAVVLSGAGLATTAAHADPTATLTVDAPATGIDLSNVPVKVTFKDPDGDPVVGAAVAVGEWDYVPLQWGCVTGDDGTCTVQVPMTNTWSLVAESASNGPYPGLKTDIFTIQHQIPTTLTLTQNNPQTPVEIGTGVVGLTATLTNSVTGQWLPGTVSFVRTDVVPNTVLTATADQSGAYVSPYPDSAGETWKAVFAGFNDELPSESATITLVNVVRTPTLAMAPSLGPSEASVDPGTAVTFNGLVMKYDLSGVAGLTAELWSRPSLNGTATKVGEATSQADGSVSVTITPHRSAYYEWRHPAGQGGYIAASSSQRSVQVKMPTTVELITAPTSPWDFADAPANSSVTVRLVDHWGDPISGQHLTINGDTTTDAVTDDDGYATLTFPTPRSWPQLGLYAVHYAGYTDALTSKGIAEDSPYFTVTINHTASVTASVPSGTPAVGAQVVLTGDAVVDGSVPGSNVPMTLWRKTATTDWAAIASAVGSHGHATVSTTVLAGTTTYEWRIGAGTGLPATVSNDVTVTGNSSVPTRMVAVIANDVVVTGASTTVAASFSRVDGLPESSTHTFQLWQSVAKGAWTKVTTITTASAYPAIAVRPLGNTRYQWRYVKTVGPLASSSNIVSVTVVPTLSAKLAKKSIKHGKAVKLRGTLSPHAAGVVVYLMQGSKRIASTKTKAGGAYSFSVKYKTKGTRTLHVAVFNNNTTSSAVSGTVKLKVT